MGFKRRSKSQLALSLLDTDAGQDLVRERLQSIEGELSALETTRKKLEAERAQLSPLVHGKASRRGGRRRGNDAGGSRRSISTDRVLSALSALDAKDTPVSKSELADQLSANPLRLKKPLDSLIADGVVERVGRGRGTRYRQL